MKAYETWLGRPAWHVTAFFNQSSWPNLMSSVPWSADCFAPVRDVVGLTFSVPMLPEDGKSTLVAGAGGTYDAYFKSIAQTLVQDDFGTSILRIGWEFNGNWEPWSSYKDPENFIRYYSRIVTIMRGVSGARFRFEWCPNIGTGSLAPDKSYPGDAYVDIVGMDVYDGHWSAGDANPVQRWKYYVAEPYGLQWQVAFATAHHKRLSLPEWGCCGFHAGDDPYFVTQIANWLSVHSYEYADYWDSNSAYRGMLSDNQYPRAGAAYIASFR